MLFFRHYTSKSDAQLVDLAAKGETRAFDQIIRRHEEAVYGFASHLLRNRQEAEDITQETFLRFYQSLNRYNSKARLITYLFRITRNLCIDFFRKKKPRFMEEPPEMLSPENPFARTFSAELRKRIDQAVACITPKQRAVIFLKYEQGMSYKVIAVAKKVIRFTLLHPSGLTSK